MRFATQFDSHPRVFVEAGTRVKTMYGPVFDDRGVMHLTEIGKHNLYAEIQSHKESVDIHSILKRYQSGDVEALSRVQGAYGDFTEMPKTYAEALNNIIGAEQYFMGLPADVRSRFNNSFTQFLASMDSPTFARDMGMLPPDPPVVAPVPGSNIGEAVAGSDPAAGVAGAAPDTPAT